MLTLDLDHAALEKIADEYAASTKQINASGNRAARRTAGAIRRLASTGLKSGLGLKNATALRRRVREFRVTKNRGDASFKIWAGGYDLPVSAFRGRPVKIPGGIKIGDQVIHGGFFAKIGSKRKIMVRYGPGAGQIAEATMPVADRMITYLEDNVFVDAGEIFLKNFLAEIRARTIYGVGG